MPLLTLKEIEMTLKLHALAKFIRDLVSGRSKNELLIAAARLERDALLMWLDTTEEGLLDREAEDRLAWLPRTRKSGLTATVLRRDRRAGVPDEVAAVFSVHFNAAEPQWREIPADNLVPGDLIALKAGDIVPADIRLLSCDDFQVDQSVLTGLAVPVRKYAGIGEGWDLQDFPNIAMTGMNVVSGRALAVVVSGGPVRARPEPDRKDCGYFSAYGFLVPQR